MSKLQVAINPNAPRPCTILHPSNVREHRRTKQVLVLVQGRGTVRGPNLLGVVGTMAGAKADVDLPRNVWSLQASVGRAFFFEIIKADIGSEDDEEDHGRPPPF